MRERARVALDQLRRRCVHPPVITASAVGAVLGTAGRLHVFAHELPVATAYKYGFSARALSMGHWETLLTSQFLSRDAFMAMSIACSLVLMLGLYEAIAGARRALVITFVTAVVGPLAAAGGLGLASVLGSSWAARTLSTLDYGSSSVTAGAGGALVAVLGIRRARQLAVIWVLGGLVVHHQLADWEHVASFIAGYGLGRMLGVAAGTTRSKTRVTDAHPWALAGQRVAIAPLLALGLWGGSSAAAGALPLNMARPTPPPAASNGGSRPAEPSAAQVIDTEYPTPSLGGTRGIFVILPAGYDQSQARYPVIELLHGTPGGRGDIIAGLDPITAAAQPGVPPFIGVAPDGHGTVVSDGDFADTSRQRLGAALSDDLRRWVNAHYRTNGHWGVAGLSAGGYGAAYLAARTPGTYDAVCSLSGYFTAREPAFAGESTRAREAASPLLHARPDGPRTLLVAGTNDRDAMQEARRYQAAMNQVSQPNDALFVAGTHSWELFKHELPECLRYILAAPPTNHAASPGATR